MSVSIVEILSGDKGFDLQNGHWIRPWAFGTSWTTIRIGARFHFPVTSAALLTGTPEFWFGLCNGTTNAPGVVAAASVDHALFQRSVAASFTYASSGNMLIAASATGQIAKIVSGSLTTSNLNNSTILGSQATGPVTIRQQLVVTITKGSPNYTVASQRRTTSSGADVSYATLLAGMESATPSSILPGTENTTTIAVDEGTDGTLDHVFIRWNRTTVPLYVSEVLVARVA